LIAPLNKFVRAIPDVNLELIAKGFRVGAPDSRCQVFSAVTDQSRISALVVPTIAGGTKIQQTIVISGL
jgi:hypothetical protein